MFHCGRSICLELDWIQILGLSVTNSSSLPAELISTKMGQECLPYRISLDYLFSGIRVPYLVAVLNERS